MEVRLDIKGEELLERVIGKPVFLQELEKLTAKVLEEELEEKHDIKSIEVSLTFVEPDEMLELNEQYRGIDEPTDVLSFPLWEEEDGRFLLPSKDWDEVALGDIVICPRVVIDFARASEKEPEEEIVLIYIHGLLHLLGYDHTTEEQEAIMWKKQEKYKNYIKGGR
ncbi:MAG: rRNA maturation RNase YbeY [Acetomicrobium sp.]|uniref:rRNA maturation RNase YbeY n=1 Tax=Acetomicrobium TaxID=49894 RepID=UPI0026EB0C27|nr:rRNA maturation RNase YbeY [Acetomicrobium mobile]MDI9377359.1 rRNA maturation RNase YbeY [Synergistota bacterium]HOB10111.1 rRNA maturation RNase YbeY [Acetomicrobium sp.]HOM98320.1 rRNA maturation RNase YbeY [Acetomicrobium sp.]HQA35744.1 rRNA maturation RNase YbeY [Acetomicrobium sp.]HQC87483.1 rRNA maturation RNase YbeY [Acetomicrobium sp.]